MSILNLFRKTPQAQPVKNGKKESKGDRLRRKYGMFRQALALVDNKEQAKTTIAAAIENAMSFLPQPDNAHGMDATPNAPDLMSMAGGSTVSSAVVAWYMSQGFIGFQTCAFMFQHWLVKNACEVVSKDAISCGFEIANVDGDGLSPQAQKIIKKYNKKFKINDNLEEFVTMGRCFGIRIALFDVASTDDKYYEKPFNPDGIEEGAYRGISQIDPYWCAPVMVGEDALNPASKHFYEPTYWMIAGKKYHRSHLVIFLNSKMPDILKPMYSYGSVSVPQMIYEQVYSAERLADEAPALAMSKRTGVLGIDAEEFLSSPEEAMQRISKFAYYSDNFQTRVIDKESESFDQKDASLTDLDSLTTQGFQLVAAALLIPITKLLGTPPKGFNATGEEEAGNYRKLLKGIQASHMTELIERHTMLTIASYVTPVTGESPEIEVVFSPLDSPKDAELATTNQTKVNTLGAAVNAGFISAEEARGVLVKDKTSGLHGLGEALPDDLIQPESDESMAQYVAGLLEDGDGSQA